MQTSILNIAGGKIKPFDFPESKIDLYSKMNFLVNLDQMYFNPTSIEEIIKSHNNYSNLNSYEYNSNMDIYEFLERYHILFDGIAMYRFLEHVPKTKVLYFIYLLSTVLKIGGYVDIIVPDYAKLAHRILTEQVYSIDFESQDIITTFELLNEPYCPHASIWTEARFHYFFAIEERFKIEYLKTDYNFDGRDIYIRAIFRRIK